MARKRQKNVIRTDFIENRIAHCWAIGAYDMMECWEHVASVVNAPIDKDYIESEMNRRKKIISDLYK